LPAAPDVPALAQSGYPGFEAGTWFGLMAPAGTPREIIARVHGDMVKVLRLPEIQERLAAQGGTTVGNTPEQFAAYIRSESDKWAKVLKASGVRAD
jgi:tripartite-type tricarboxylate transporter receptor subunit TctC